MGTDASRLVVEEVRQPSPDLLEPLNALLAQLSASAAPMALGDLERIVASDASRLFVAREDGQLLGMTTLVLVRIPSGVRAIVEDVVVDVLGRGRGIGRALVTYALEEACRAGARSVDLTSRPERVAAHALYRSIGFVPRDTTVYRYALGDEHASSRAGEP